MKQTAVEWLMSQMLAASINKETQEMHITLPKDVFKQAKAMEKEQIRDAYMQGYLEEIPNPSPSHYYEDMAEQYYNETFKSE